MFLKRISGAGRRFASRMVLMGCLVLGQGAALAPVASAEGLDGLFSIFEPSDEASIGKQQHPRILAQYGGEYVQEGLNEYILDVGLRLAFATGRTDISWQFTILNSPVVNAFALPGGYVYISRGLLALANNEAEIAGVLAHEIGHVIARHGAQRQSRATGLGLLGALAGILTQNADVFRMGQTVGGLYLAGYSRDQEFEADQLGVKYLGLAGYPREAMAGFLKRMQAHAEFQSRLAGNGGQSQFDFFATHPQTDDRIARAEQLAAREADALERHYGQAEFMTKLDGILYGDDIKEGVIRSRWFLHPDLRLKFRAPKGFQLINSQRAVYAVNGKGYQMVFDLDPGGLKGLSVSDYLRRVWMREQNLRYVDDIQVGGAQAARTELVLQQNGKRIFVTAVAINFGYDKVARFVYTGPDLNAELRKLYRGSYNSFQPMTYDEAMAIKPVHLDLRFVENERSVEQLVKSMADLQNRKALFILLNPEFDGKDPEPGDPYKLPVYGR
ncbi:M48 family metalloprotease [Sneathiella chinensis]|uniref:Metalloprotease n=1 Tax=Sneathiella chinensis TaxID=349750 RepID=A0ABQ5U8N4_9PROT|nr:M48 family metalloprotease [Sneathiella chinensis]GLQ08038.1 metalloprotease [Sneathiella chinensis]